MVNGDRALLLIREVVGGKKFKDITKSDATFFLWLKMMERYKDKSKRLTENNDGNR